MHAFAETRLGPNFSGNFANDNLLGDGTGVKLTDGDNDNRVGTADDPIDPMFGPLTDNDGPTQTIALLPGGPAIGAGDKTGHPRWDHRGRPYRRVVRGRTDIGAFEVQNDGSACTATVGRPRFKKDRMPDSAHSVVLLTQELRLQPDAVSRFPHHAINSRTTRPCTSVSRKSRPAYRYVSFS